jgi:alkanesulfonate monooxygenase SsuD/methylene tetrahydromethanopterin reductase-like flavin-dependent oxidoreductase (luciferase family)
MSDYGRPIEFGISVVPMASDLTVTRNTVSVADSLGLDLVGIQDHPYQWRFLDTWTLIADLLARTKRIRVFPDVANLPLRAPAMIAKQAASLDVLSGGRFELGLGAGGFWQAIEAMGGPLRTPPEALAALEEAVNIIRLFWSGERTITFQGRFYSVRGLHPGPAPLHRIEIWIGALRPRMLTLIGRLADGWVPSIPYAPPESVPAMQGRIDESAKAAGRTPREIRRVYNLMGEIIDGPTQGLLQGPVSHWVDALTGFAIELGFDTLVFWPSVDPVHQTERFATEVVPAVRAAVERARRPSANTALSR